MRAVTLSAARKQTVMLANVDLVPGTAVIVDDATYAAIPADVLADCAVVILGATPGSPSAYTQTYSTAARTVPNATYAAPAVTAGPFTYPGSGNLHDAVAADLLITVRNDTVANAVADLVVNVKSLADNVNQAIVDNAATNTQLAALAADVLALKKVVTALIDDLQSVSIVA